MEGRRKHGDLNLFILRNGCRLDATQARREANKRENYRQQNKQENKEKMKKQLKNYEGDKKSHDISNKGAKKKAGDQEIRREVK